MNRNSRFRILTLLTATVWTAAIGNLALRKRLAAKANVSVQLTTEPKIVRILVKGDKSQPSGYLETPTTLSLAPGRRKIRIARDGYRAHDMTIEGEAGDQINMGHIVLEQDPTQKFGKLDLRIEGGSVWYELDDGIMRGEQSNTIDDLVIANEHFLSVALSSEANSPRSRCRIVLQESHVETPYVVTIKRLKSKGNKPDSIKISPCDRSAPAEKKRPQRPPPNDASPSEILPKTELK